MEEPRHEVICHDIIDMKGISKIGELTQIRFRHMA